VPVSPKRAACSTIIRSALLIFAGIPLSLTAAANYTAANYRALQSRLSLTDLRDFLKLLEEYKFTRRCSSRTRRRSHWLDRLPDWQRVYSDDVAVVHRRLDSPNK